MATPGITDNSGFFITRPVSIVVPPSIVVLNSNAAALPFGLYVQGAVGGAATTNPVRILRPDGTWGFVVDITGRFIFSGGVWIPLGP